MYRRIELINQNKDGTEYKWGLMGVSHWDVAMAWANDLRGPYRSIPPNCRFYFTEKGWDKIGRKVIAACIRTNQRYRVIAIKETDAQVVWRDKYTGYEVAVQPKRKRR